MKIFSIFIIPLSVFIFSMFLDTKKIEYNEFYKFYKSYFYGILIGVATSVLFLFINNFLFNSVANHLTIALKSIFLDVPLFTLFTSFFSFIIVFNIKERLNKIFFIIFYAGIFSVLLLVNSLSYNYPQSFFEYLIFIPNFFLFVFCQYAVFEMLYDEGSLFKKNIYVASILYIFIASIFFGTLLYLNFYIYLLRYVYSIIGLLFIFILVFAEKKGYIKNGKNI